MKSGYETLAGRYRLGETIGAGGMGSVLRAYDEVLERPVAVKLLKEELAGDPETVERFRREARIAASLSHPGIASVFDFGDDAGRSFLVMELLDGRDLHRLLAEQGRLDPAVAAGIAARVGDALEHAHRRGSVHRDVKPANIFVTRSGDVMVTDFGIAHAAALAPVTVTGAVLGTPHYLAPEQAAGERATPATDVYALGCVLFQMLTGKPPYERETSFAIAAAHLNDAVPDARQVDPAVPEALAAVARRAMAKRPQERFTSAASMAAALRQAVNGETAATPLPPAPATLMGPGDPAAATPPLGQLSGGLPAGPRGPGRRRRAVVAVLALAVALLAILALAALVRRPSSARVPSLSGKTYDAAAAELERAGLRPKRIERSSAAPKDEVVGQDPGPGTELSRGGTVTLMVSRGDRRSVPDVRGQPLANALAILHSSGLASDIEGDSDEGGGVVVEQAPLPGVEVAAGSSVTLSVADPDEERDKARGKGKGRD